MGGEDSIEEENINSRFYFAVLPLDSAPLGKVACTA